MKGASRRSQAHLKGGLLLAMGFWLQREPSLAPEVFFEGGRDSNAAGSQSNDLRFSVAEGLRMLLSPWIFNTAFAPPSRTR